MPTYEKLTPIGIAYICLGFTLLWWFWEGGCHGEWVRTDSGYCDRRSFPCVGTIYIYYYIDNMKWRESNSDHRSRVLKRLSIATTVRCCSFVLYFTVMINTHRGFRHYFVRLKYPIFCNRPECLTHNYFNDNSYLVIPTEIDLRPRDPVISVDLMASIWLPSSGVNILNDPGNF